jgi:pleiotropic regulator 1
VNNGFIYERVKNIKKDELKHPPKQQNENSQPTVDKDINLNMDEAGMSSALVPVSNSGASDGYHAVGTVSQSAPPSNQLPIQPKKEPSISKPKWHAPWKLARVISGHFGCVRCVAVDPGNE